MYIQKFKLDFLRNHCADLNQSLYESFQVHEMKIWWHDSGHMTLKVAATPIYGKNLSKISGTGGPISTKLGM